MFTCQEEIYNLLHMIAEVEAVPHILGTRSPKSSEELIS